MNASRLASITIILVVIVPPPAPALSAAPAARLRAGEQLPTQSYFALQRWATIQGNLIDGMLWFVADCNGDGRDDLANRRNDADMISIDVHVAVTRFVAYLPLTAH